MIYTDSFLHGLFHGVFHWFSIWMIHHYKLQHFWGTPMTSRKPVGGLSHVSGSAHLGKHKRTKEEMGEVVPSGTALPQVWWKNLGFAEGFLELSMESPLLGESIGEIYLLDGSCDSLIKSKLFGTIDEQLGRHQSFGLTKATWKTGCQVGEPAERRKIGSYRQGGVLRPVFLWRFCVRESGCLLHAGWLSTKSLDVTKSWKPSCRSMDVCSCLAPLNVKPDW